MSNVTVLDQALPPVDEDLSYGAGPGGYAVRNDKKSCRRVASPDDVGDGEHYSLTPIDDAPAEDLVLTQLRNLMQMHLDNAARAAGYDDIKAAVTYAEEPAVPKFQAEGRALRAWRSLVWAYGYEQVKAVKAGERDMPTPDQFIAELPELVMPDSVTALS